MSEVRIRTAGRADAARLNDALAKLSEDLGDDHLATDETLAAACSGEGSAVRAVLAETGEDIVGAALYSPVFSTRRGAAGLYVSDLWVASHRRGDRLGKRLLQEAARDAGVRWDARFLRLAVYHDNIRARRFYERIGFTEEIEERLMLLDQQHFVSLMDEA